MSLDTRNILLSIVDSVCLKYLSDSQTCPIGFEALGYDWGLKVAMSLMVQAATVSLH